jgi:aminoglycoside phosphotransferase (APT) family kinase protein
MALVRERTALPVPEIVLHERSSEFLGAPFLVVRAIEGEVASDNPLYLRDEDGWFLRGTPDDRRRMEAGTIALFAELHRLRDDGETTAFLHVDAPGGTPLARLLASHRAYYDWAREGMTIPTLERAFDALGRTLPPNGRSVVLWGDGRPGNILYRDFEPVGALDWEMAGIGPPEADVAWTTFFHRFFTFMAETPGTDPVPVMFRRDDVADAYERAGGVPLDDLTWYEGLAGLRFGIILVRMLQRGLAYADAPLPDDRDSLMLFAPLMHEILDEVEARPTAQ